MQANPYAASAAIIGLIASAILAYLGIRAYRRAVALSRQRIPCPQCSEPIQQAAEVCPSCKADLRSGPYADPVARQLTDMARIGREALSTAKFHYALAAIVFVASIVTIYALR